MVQNSLTLSDEGQYWRSCCLEVAVCRALQLCSFHSRAFLKLSNVQCLSEIKINRNFCIQKWGYFVPWRPYFCTQLKNDRALTKVLFLLLLTLLIIKWNAFKLEPWCKLLPWCNVKEAFQPGLLIPCASNPERWGHRWAVGAEVKDKLAVQKAQSVTLCFSGFSRRVQKGHHQGQTPC